MTRNVSDKDVDQFLSESRWDTVGLSVPKEDAKPAKTDKQVNESKDKKPAKAEKHVCPLCESELAEEISDERLLEHSQEILEVFNAVDEAVQEMLSEEGKAKEDDEEDEDEESDEDSEESDEDEDEDEEGEDDEDEDE